MNLHDEIAKVAAELYEKSGRIEGRTLENWLEAEKIVLSRHSSKEIAEPKEAPSVGKVGVKTPVIAGESGASARTGGTKPFKEIIKRPTISEAGITKQSEMKKSAQKVKPVVAKGKKKNPVKASP